MDGCSLKFNFGRLPDIRMRIGVRAMGSGDGWEWAGLLKDKRRGGARGGQATAVVENAPAQSPVDCVSSINLTDNSFGLSCRRLTMTESQRLLQRLTELAQLQQLVAGMRIERNRAKKINR